MSVEFGGLDPSRAAQTSDAAAGGVDSKELEAHADVERGEVAARDDGDRIRSLLDRLHAAGPNIHARLSIDRDDDAGAYVYRILDSRSGEVVRQFPQEQTLELMRFLGKQQGLIVDFKA